VKPLCRAGPAILCCCLLLAACERKLGYGVLLWANEETGIPSGTVLPVYIRSNIDQVWVVGVPREYQSEGGLAKAEIPLAQLDLAGSKHAAEKRLAAFAAYARTYAETLQDGLPVREDPDNSSRRVYRLRLGEIIKVLSRAEGNPAISASGAPLAGDWYRVLTKDGTRGYCFSYRLRLFEHEGGPLTLLADAGGRDMDRDLEEILSKTWVAEVYGLMQTQGKLNIEDLEKGWGFTPGEDTGIATVYLPDANASFEYTSIKAAGPEAWSFEGAPLSMQLRSDTTLVVQWSDRSGYERAAAFVNLPVPLSDLIEQEQARRETLFLALYEAGPLFTSAAYGTLAFREDGTFSWAGNQSLVPQVIPASALGTGRVEMRLFLGPTLAGRYTGAFSLVFNVVSGRQPVVNFLYSFDGDTGGIRMEYVPPLGLDGATVIARAASPLVIYFYKDGAGGGAWGETQPGGGEYGYGMDEDLDEFDDPDLSTENESPTTSVF